MNDTVHGVRGARVLAEAGRPGCALLSNCLSDAGGAPGEDLGPSRRFHTASLAAWALDRTPRIILRTDDLPSHDATIAMFTP